MLNPSDYLGKDALWLCEKLRLKDFTAEELTYCAISLAEEINPKINAIVTNNFDQALLNAKYIDKYSEHLEISPISGLPFLIKDLSTVKGLPATFGSNLFLDHKAKESSKIVKKYMKAGLNVLRLSNTPEFGLTITTEPAANGVTKNPWNLDYSTGGSSGGAAAAVAAGIMPVAHATDGGGSIRIPASCCGLFGLKPSRGLTSIENAPSDSWDGMSVGHVVSQTIRDSAAFLDAIKLDYPHLYPIPAAPSSFLATLEENPRQLRVGLQLSHPADQPIDQACLDGVKIAAQLCESLGHNVEEITHPVDYTPVVSAMSKMINTFVFQRINTRVKELGITQEEAQLEKSTRIVASLGAKVTALEYLKAREILHSTERTMNKFHKSYDVIISPVLSKEPAKLGWLDMDSEDMRNYTNNFRAYSGFTSIYNGTGQPSMSMPLHRSENGLPIGVMFTSKWGSDALLLGLAKQLEALKPWPRYTEN